MFLAVPRNLQRNVLAPAEERMFLPPQLQRAMHGPQLHPSTCQVAKHIAAHCGRPLLLCQLMQGIEITRAQVVIYRPPVIRVDQSQLPELAALVKVRDPGRGDLEHHLGQRIHRSKQAQLGQQPVQRGNEWDFLYPSQWA